MRDPQVDELRAGDGRVAGDSEDPGLGRLDAPAGACFYEPAMAATATRAGRLTLSVIVPVYNERPTILEILERVACRPEVDEMVVVDDCSTDGTGDALREQEGAGWPALAAAIGRPLPRILLFHHDMNQGKGAALRTGFARASGDVFLTQDADLEYDPADYERLLAPIQDGRADAVYGSRFAGWPRRVLYFWHALGNKVLTLISNMLCDLNLTDMETGYKAIRREIVQRMVLRSQRFGIEPEITAKLAQLRARIYEVPISYSGRSYAEGKKIGWKDAVSAIWTMLRCALVDDREQVDPLHATLRRMAALDRYNAFLFDTIRPAIGRRVLEVGAGTGTMTSFLRDRDRVVATDFDPHYVHLLERRFESSPNVAVASFDLEEGAPAAIRSQSFDTVLCLNVVEHLRNDRAAVARLADLLEPGGRLILLVPAHPALYGTMDEAVGHHRRYARGAVAELLGAAGLEVESETFVNAVSTAGWYLNGKLLKRRAVPGIQARLANLLVPLYRLERALGMPFGLSMIGVGRRRAEARAA
jgi:glycosyltransferase involved in cell wall biosynthesis/phospholipid N-methyltransferase